jgi:hypothetical protein
MRTRIFSTIALSTLLAAGAFAASGTNGTAQAKHPATPVMQAAAKPARKLPSMSGTIVSFNDSNLVLSHGKKKLETSFMLNSETRREGTLSNGARATVWYRRDGANRIAAMIRVRGTHSTAHHAAAHARAKAS